MKVAWIGFFATILGALIGVFGSPVVSNFIDGPKEGVFSVDSTCLNAENIAEELKKQISSYPCNLRIAHIDGPPVKNLSVKLKSDYILSDIEELRNDEGYIPKISADEKEIALTLTQLRKKAVIDLRFTSNNGVSLNKEIVMSEGSLIDQNREIRKKEWYESDYFLIPVFISALFVLATILYFVIKTYIEPTLKSVSVENIKVFASIAVVTAIIPLPFFGALSTIFIIYALFLILTKLNDKD